MIGLHLDSAKVITLLVGNSMIEGYSQKIGV
jgi:hypothetical protein